MSVEISHECDTPLCRREVTRCVCDNCFDTAIEESFEEGKKEGLSEAENN